MKKSLFIVSCFLLSMSAIQAQGSEFEKGLALMLELNGSKESYNIVFEKMVIQLKIACQM